jgi:hypothetical protein
MQRKINEQLRKATELKAREAAAAAKAEELRKLKEANRLRQLEI